MGCSAGIMTGYGSPQIEVAWSQDGQAAAEEPVLRRAVFGGNECARFVKSVTRKRLSEFKT